jgi:hypothetical protein
MATDINKILELKEMQRMLRTENTSDKLASIGARKGGPSPVPPQRPQPPMDERVAQMAALEEAKRTGQMAAQQGTAAGHEAAQAGIQRGQELAPPPIPGGTEEELGFMGRGGARPPMEIKQDLNDILTATLPTGDSIAALAIQALLKNANLDIEGMVRAEEGGRLKDESGGGLMEIAAGGEFSGIVEGEGHGMEDNIRMPIKKGTEQVGTLAVSPSEYVVDSYTMAALGNGNPDAGADVMDEVVEDVREKAYGTREQPNEINGLAALRPMVERV